MYRADTIKNKFINLIGWRHHHSPVDYTIKDELTKSESGQYYQDFHPLITLDNIRSVAPEFYKGSEDGKIVGCGLIALDDELTLAVCIDGGVYHLCLSDLIFVARKLKERIASRS